MPFFDWSLLIEVMAFLSDLRSTLTHLAWIVALVATAGSLFFSEVMDLPPCVLCWYQRIAMYPLVVVIAVGIILRDHRAKFHSLPLAIAGLGIAVYHNLLYYGFIPESIIPCTQGISCTSRQIEWLGFITIPLLSLTAFVIVTVCLALSRPAKVKADEVPERVPDNV